MSFRARWLIQPSGSRTRRANPSPATHVSAFLHDGLATVCVEDAPFAYVGVFRNHVNVGFFHGARLPDPAGLLEGTGKSMRHVPLKPGVGFDRVALEELLAAAYRDIVTKLALVESPAGAG